MEKKKKDKKVVSANGQEPQSNDFLRKEEENGIKRKNTKTCSPLHDNVSVRDQLYPQTLQGPYTSQCSAEQPVLISRPHAPFATQWQQSPALQKNANDHPIQHGQPTLHLAQSNPPFWMPQRPGYQLAGVNAPGNFQPFNPVATVDPCCQASAMLGGNPSRSQLPVPNLCYHVNHPYSGFSGPWDPSPWWAYTQQPQPSCAYNFPPGAHGPFTHQASLTATFGESLARGTIRPKAKLSQKHQELWEAQSAENVQLWSVIAQLQSEIADHKSRLTKLEAEVSSIKPAGNELATPISPPSLASKRGRPKRSATSADVLVSSNGSRPRVRGRKPTASKAQVEATALECQNNAEENGEKKIQNAAISNGDHVLEVNTGNASTPAFQCQFGTNSTSEIKISDNKVDDPNHSEENKLKGRSIIGNNNNALGWPGSVYPEENGRNVFDMRGSQCLYDNNGRMTVTRGNEWHFVEEEDASDELDDATAKDDDSSSGAEEIARKKAVDSCDVDDAIGTCSGTLPQFNNW